MQIVDGAGGDCTAMFEAIHPLSVTESNFHSKWCIGEVRDYDSFYSWDGAFYKSLKQRVEKAIPSKDRRFSYPFFIKSVILLIGYFVCFYYYIANNTILIAVIFAYFASAVINQTPEKPKMRIDWGQPHA
jgi:predicted membrane protein